MADTSWFGRGLIGTLGSLRRGEATIWGRDTGVSDTEPSRASITGME